MSGTYLVCDLCGNYGPPASFLGKDGLRLCYQCAYQEDVKVSDDKQPHQQENSQTPQAKDAHDH